MSNALLSGVTGLTAHQKMIDVAGNNLANVNTTAYKSSRVTFAEMLSETLQDASAPTANLGGTNPMQAGSGVKVGSIDRDMSQGSLVFTGNPLDVAIEGAGYFVLNDGLGDRYTRVGQFAVDADYYLVDPTTGYRVQRVGSEGTAEGFQDPTSNDIRIPYDIALPAQETSTISFAGNLSANKDEPTKNLLTSDVKYVLTDGSIASYPSELADLSQAGNLTNDDTIHIEGTTKSGNAVDFYYRYNDGTGRPERLVFDTGNSVTSLAAGTAFLTNTDGALARDLDFNFGVNTITVTIPAATTWTAAQFKAAFDAAALLAGTTYTANYAATPGNQMVIEEAAPGVTANTFILDDAAGAIKWGLGAADDELVGAVQDYHYWDGVDAAATGDDMDTFLEHISRAFDEDGESTSTAKIVNGVMRLEDDDAGYSLAYISGMTFADEDGSGSTFTCPSQFDIITAGGGFEKPVNVEVFDEQGNSYTLAGAFVRTNTANVWDFVVKSIGGDTQVIDRRCQGIKFQVDGSFGEMQGTDSMSITLAYPSNVGVFKTITLDMGTLGEMDGLTQFGGSSTAATSGQDGYAAGWLSTLSVSSEGTLVGVFTNGVRRDVAALKIATFQNSAGLKAIGGNYFSPTANSGDPVPNKATEGSAGVCNGGAIEKSNVEVAEEFVKLIEAQNGYQASARTIKVANEMLQELTNLIR
ncbi:MAG: flagellar hook-basal body complex protein [Phycisphaerae bacterium]|nr:flagellar hook-basal body complex protein [Phycisphaerae bacterium]